MFQKTTIFIALIVNLLLFTQAIGQNADCSSMLILKDTIYHSGAIAGFGNKKEFEGNELENKKVFENEENSIWYFIKTPTDGVFTFDIITENENDDWDFLLFKYEESFCEKIEDNKNLAIRTNLSRSPITGLARNAKEKFVGAGINDNYSKPIQVHKEDKYVLVVNNPKKSGGKHTLILHYPQKKGIQEIIKDTIVQKEEPKTIFFKLSIKDSLTKKLIPSHVIISGIRKKVIELDTITNYETHIVKKSHTVSVYAHAKGYLLTSKEFKIAKTKMDYSVELMLEKIEPGKKINLKDIQFYGNRYDFLPSAKSSLHSLLSFMNQNDNVFIEVEGHVNGPGKSNSKSYQDLSYSRAYAVKEYLIKNGIDKKRIDFKGYGNSQMLYPKPKSSFQESANRRVEIKILSNE